MSSHVIKYRIAVGNALTAARRLLSATPKGHPEHSEAASAFRSTCVIAARLAFEDGDHEYRQELLAELGALDHN